MLKTSSGVPGERWRTLLLLGRLTTTQSIYEIHTFYNVTSACQNQIDGAAVDKSR